MAAQDAWLDLWSIIIRRSATPSVPSSSLGINSLRLQLDTIRLTPDLPTIRELATCYTAAWCNQNPATVASFFSPDGSLRVNDDPPAIGRDAIMRVAQSFMTAFPDLCVSMDDLLQRADTFEYHWTLVGTNAGPGGTGQKVRISGYEEWRMGRDSLIAALKGHFDATEYRRQVEQGMYPKSANLGSIRHERRL